MSRQDFSIKGQVPGLWGVVFISGNTLMYALCQLLASIVLPKYVLA
jgi:hypothetical protein